MTAGWARVGHRSSWLLTPLRSLSSAVGVTQLPLPFLLSCAQSNPISLVLHSWASFIHSLFNSFFSCLIDRIVHSADACLVGLRSVPGKVLNAGDLIRNSPCPLSASSYSGHRI